MDLPPNFDSAVKDMVSEVKDWDDDAVSIARFKAFSGQRSDWEPRFVFWRDLIIKVARHLRVFTIQASQVKHVWFSRSGLSPLCMDHVLREMHASGDILLGDDLIDPTSGWVYQCLRKLGRLSGYARSRSLPENYEGHLILRTLLEEKCNNVAKTLTEGHYFFHVVTMGQFQSLFEISYEASICLRFLCEMGKAKYFSIRGDDSIEGIKFFVVQGQLPGISALDSNVLHLLWTAEKLQKELDVVNRRWKVSKENALASLKLGNRQAARRFVRQAKVLSTTRDKYASFLERVEECISNLGSASTTKKVTEAVQIGVRAIKENKIGMEEVHRCLGDLDEVVSSQEQIEEALGSAPVHLGVEDEELEVELNKLEMDMAMESPLSQASVVLPTGPDILHEPSNVGASSTVLLSQTMSKLALESEV